MSINKKGTTGRVKKDVAGRVKKDAAGRVKKNVAGRVKLRVPTAKDVQNRTVLVRVDFNVPTVLQDGRVTVADDKRIQATLKTIHFLQKNQAKIVLMSHFGRPGGEKKPEFSLQPVAQYLQTKLQLPVTFVSDCIGKSVRSAAKQLRPSEILLLENTRFYPQETKNDSQFANSLAVDTYADLYINEAFSTSHRAHASTEGITHYLPSFAGFTMEKEVETLSQLMHQPQHPFVILVGGAKISDKIGALENLLDTADAVLVGGGVANNFLKAEGIEIHKSYLQDVPVDQQKEAVNYIKVADEMIEETKSEKILKDGYIPLPKIIYPIDVVAAPSPDSTETQIIDLTHDMADTPDDQQLMYLDIGPKTIHLYSDILNQAHSVFWNGPMGMFEHQQFATGTTQMAEVLAKSTAVTVLGGGDTAAAVEKLGLETQYTYVSTAGGAGLAFLAGEEMPGISPLVRD